MPDEMLSIVEALAQLQGAKTFEEMGQVAQRWWGTLQSPVVPIIIDQMLRTQKKEGAYVGAILDAMKVQRFLQNAKQHDIPWAVTEEERITNALFQAITELFKATPDTITQILASNQALILSPFGVNYAKWVEIQFAGIDEKMITDELKRRARKERRQIVIRFLEDASSRGVGYAKKRFDKDFEALIKRIGEQFRLKES